jgi:pimeloyl-ACP methyl ester carboxylesterase
MQTFVDAFSSFNRAAAAVTVRTVLTRSPGLADVLARIRAPLAILMGAEDRLYPPDAMRPFAALAPHARIDIIKECGHLAPLEAPEAVAQAIRDLLVASPDTDKGGRS